MKTTLLLLAAMLTSLFCYSTTRTCSNDPVGGAQYTTLDDVFNASIDGDTILLEKSNFPYRLDNYFDWERSLTVIGIGINPEITSDYQCVIDQMGVFSNISPQGSGSKFYGITFSTNVEVRGASNIIFENCFFESGSSLYFTSSMPAEKVLVINTVFEGIGDANVEFLLNSNFENIHFLNCIFNGYVDGNGLSDPGITIDHCLFTNVSGIGRNIRNFQNATISNSILAEGVMGYPVVGMVDCIFLNNFSSNAVNVPPPDDASVGNFNNTGSGNFDNYPSYINYTIGDGYSPDQDYNLLPTSHGVNAATDGTDIGVHGGFTNFNEALEPSVVPIVTSTTILDGGTEVGGTIELNVQARKPLPN